MFWPKWWTRKYELKCHQAVPEQFSSWSKRNWFAYQNINNLCWANRGETWTMYTNTVCIIWTVSSKGQLPALRNSLKLVHGLFEQSNVQLSLKAAYNSSHGKKCFPSYVFTMKKSRQIAACNDLLWWNEIKGIISP